MRKRDEPEVFRLSFLHDKLGRQIGVIYYYEVSIAHRKLIKKLFKSFDLSTKDKTMLRTALRVGDYSEHDQTRLKELRRMYIEDNS